jgi:glutamate/tyrosine decarboxylase-like PLP-dependent enzyme
MAELIERCCAHARRFEAGLRGAGYEVLNDVVLNQVVVSFGSDARTGEVIRAIQRDGVCWCGGTEWRGRAGMRISVSGWATQQEDVDSSLASILKCALAR